MKKKLLLIAISFVLIGCTVDEWCTKEVYKNDVLVERQEEVAQEGFCDCQPTQEYLQGNYWEVVCY